MPNEKGNKSGREIIQQWTIEDGPFSPGRRCYRLERIIGTHCFLLIIDGFNGRQGLRKEVEINCTKEEALEQAEKLVQQRF